MPLVYKYSICLFIFLFSFSSSLLTQEFKNTNGKEINKSSKELFKWRSSRKSPETTQIEMSNEWQLFNFENNDNYSFWVGHSTYLIKINGIVILTDPIFSDRASPFDFIGPKRLIPPAIPLNKLPDIDVITISHNHYDHLDIKSLKKIYKKNPDVKILVPMGDKKLLKRHNVNNVFEFNWWDNINIENFTFTFTPVQHWSARGLFDRNESLWGGWYFTNNETSLFHAGDTGYSSDFKDINMILGSPDYAFIPIGAYDPEWFMSESHVNPEEAIQIMKDLEFPVTYAMHWGTFTLTSEDTIEPPIRLNKELENMNLNQFNVVKPGEIINLK